jgi:ribosomal protein L11
MLELKINPAKYAQYKLLYKDKSFDFVVKPPAAVQLLEAAKLKSGLVNQIVKKVALLGMLSKQLLKIKW